MYVMPARSAAGVSPFLTKDLACHIPDEGPPIIIGRIFHGVAQIVALAARSPRLARTIARTR